jgi:multidrug resistance protein, MATE family
MNARNKQILQLAVPSIISNITVPLLGLVDVTIVGHIGDASYIGAIAVGSMLFNVIYWLFGFLRMGTSGMTSQALGRRDFAEVMRLLVRSLSVGVGIGLLFFIFQKLVIGCGLWAMSPEANVLDLARRYCYVCIWGAPAVLGLYGFNGWYIGMQNTRIPMMVSLIQNVVNIVVSL